MLVTAFTLAVLTTSGFFVIYRKLPRKVRRFLEKHSLGTDAVALLLTYMLLGGTLTALIAGALVGLMTSALLFISQHPEDFEFLADVSQVIKDGLTKLKAMAKEFGAEYRANKLEAAKITE
jgi:hypothetical protein